MTAILALMATFNRVDKTMACIRSVNTSAKDAGALLRIIVADASSVDGTRAKIEAEFDNVECMTVAPSNYWASSMRLAWEKSSKSDADYLLWLNDDVELFRTAVPNLLETAESYREPAVVVGPCTDSAGTAITYSGLNSVSRLNRLRLERVFDEDRPVLCDAFNGNVVLIPREIDLIVGGFPDRYTHSMADIDYGFKLTQRNIPAIVAPHRVGVCERNEIAGSWQDTTLPAETRWRLIKSPKGLPFSEWMRLSFRVGGLLGIVSATKPYAKLVLTLAAQRLLNGLRHKGASDTTGAEEPQGSRSV